MLDVALILSAKLILFSVLSPLSALVSTFPLQTGVFYRGISANVFNRNPVEPSGSTQR